VDVQDVYSITFLWARYFTARSPCRLVLYVHVAVAGVGIIVRIRSRWARPYLCDGRSFACLPVRECDSDVCIYRCITSDLKLFLTLYNPIAFLTNISNARGGNC
jgi:hypothetical protein